MEAHIFFGKNMIWTTGGLDVGSKVGGVSRVGLEGNFTREKMTTPLAPRSNVEPEKQNDRLPRYAGPSLLHKCSCQHIVKIVPHALCRNARTYARQRGIRWLAQSVPRDPIFLVVCAARQREKNCSTLLVAPVHAAFVVVVVVVYWVSEERCLERGARCHHGTTSLISITFPNRMRPPRARARGGRVEERYTSTPRLLKCMPGPGHAQWPGLNTTMPHVSKVVLRPQSLDPHTTLPLCQVTRWMSRWTCLTGPLACLHYFRGAAMHLYALG